MTSRVEFKTISKEIIKPSSPTPHHLANLKLSSLDQIAPSIYVPVILFYSHKNQHLDTTSSTLKNSLSQTLTRFYPFAGKILRNFTIDCNDEGVEFVQVRVSGANLKDLTETPDMMGFHRFLPIESNGGRDGSRKSGLLAVQLNVLDCGGIAIGVCISHKIADGATIFAFINSWAANANYPNIDSPQDHPNFSSAAYHFPPLDHVSENLQRAGIITNSKIVTRRFVFGKSQISEMKLKGTAGVTVPTRVEAVSAFMWARFMSSLPRLQGKVCRAAHSVNLRERMVPRLEPMQSIGNIYRLVATAPPLANRLEKDYGSLVRLLRDAIREVDNDYIEKLKDGTRLLEDGDPAGYADMECLNFSSWCRFRVYEAADFGWGKPCWVSLSSLPYTNSVQLLDTKDGDGIEAFVHLVEQDMAVFKHDPELVPFISCSTNNV